MARPRVGNRGMKRTAAGVLRSVLGDHAFRALRGHRRPSSTALLGQLADPDSVPDAFAEHGVPDGCEVQRGRDSLLPIYDPKFADPDSVDLEPAELVIGIGLNGEARAYPVEALNKREMVLDRIGDTPVLVSWCKVCGTAMAHLRLVDGIEVVFGNQGALCRRAMTWWDHDTGSIWSQPLGQAIAGKRTGKTVEMVPSTLTTWQVWRTDHPDTLVLRSRSHPWGHKLDNLAVVVSHREAKTAYPMATLRAMGLVNDSVGGAAVGIVVDRADAARWTVFSRSIDRRVLEFEAREDRIVDTETGTVWDPWTGDAIAGTHAGRSLTKLPAFTIRPKAFARFWPDGRIWSERPLPPEGGSSVH